MSLISTHHTQIVELIGQPAREKVRYERVRPTSGSYSVGQEPPEPVYDGYEWDCGCWTKPGEGFGQTLWARCAAHRPLRPV